MKKTSLLLGTLLCMTLVSGCNNTSSSSQKTSSSKVEEVVNYTVEKGVKYAGENSHKRQIADLYLPTNVEGKTPVVVLVHGGAFKMGNETMFASTAKKLANLGFGVACVDYRVISDALFPAAIGDVKAAVRFVRKNAETYNFNENQVITMGESAGAYLAVMAAITGGTRDLNADVIANSDISSSVQYCVDFYGPSDVKEFKDGGLCNFLGLTSEEVDLESNIELVNKALPETYFENYTSESFPQFIIQHGDADTTVSCEESKSLYNKIVTAFGEEKAELELKAGKKHMDQSFFTEENLTIITNKIKDYFNK